MWSLGKGGYGSVRNSSIIDKLVLVLNSGLSVILGKEDRTSWENSNLSLSLSLSSFSLYFSLFSLSSLSHSLSLALSSGKV